MNKTKKLWMFATILICGTTFFMTACKKAEVQEENPARR